MLENSLKLSPRDSYEVMNDWIEYKKQRGNQNLIKNDPIEAYSKQHFCALYQTHDESKIADSDIILIVHEPKNSKFEESYQTFVNLFNNSIVLIQNSASKECVEKHPEYPMSWKINTNIPVFGWSDRKHMKAFKNECPNISRLVKLQSLTKYNKSVENDDNFKAYHVNFQEMFNLNNPAKNDIPHSAKLGFRDYNLQQKSLIDTIKWASEKKKSPIIVIGQLLNLKISPNGYKHPKQDQYVDQKVANPDYMVSKSDIESIVGDCDVERLPEAKWREEFWKHFGDKKVVLLFDKSAIVNYHEYLGRAMDFKTHQLENQK